MTISTNKAMTIGAVAFAGFALWAYFKSRKGAAPAAEQAVSGSAPSTFGAGWFLGPDPKERGGLYSFDDPEFKAMVGL
jgi:hypothetical protein